MFREETSYCLSISICRTRRNEQGVDEDVDHEPARAATCKTELTVPNHYGKHINFLCPSSVTGDCLMVIANR